MGPFFLGDLIKMIIPSKNNEDFSNEQKLQYQKYFLSLVENISRLESGQSGDESKEKNKNE
jgi:hypothetical protein